MTSESRSMISDSDSALYFAAVDEQNEQTRQMMLETGADNRDVENAGMTDGTTSRSAPSFSIFTMEPPPPPPPPAPIWMGECCLFRRFTVLEYICQALQ